MNLKIINVFVNEKGEFGNPVGVIIDEKNEISSKHRQEICKNSGLSEVVFINSSKDRDISIFCPTGEIEFAGHAVIGTAWFLEKMIKSEINSLKSLGHKIAVRHEDRKIWVRADLKTMPPWNFKQLASPSDVNKIKLSDKSNFKHIFIWAWGDKDNGIVRARTFAPDWCIPEDEANGSGSTLLAKKLKRNLKINHGKGSIIYTNYIDSKHVEVGGMIVETKFSKSK
jgi:predicted PhzF superfamily epimerase YddE/YHI9